MSATIPPEPLFQLQLAGHKGYGLFATRDIIAGTRLICEEPLIATPTIDTIGALITQLEALQPKQHELYTELSYHKRTCDAKQREALRAWLATQHQYTDIKAGEELTASYILNVPTKEQRQEQLAEGWGFKCQCKSCTGRVNEAATSEKRRERMFQIDQGFALFENGMRLNAPGSVPRNTREALSYAEKLVELFKKEMILGMDLAQTYRECSKYSLAEGLYSKAVDYAKKELELEQICVGEETEHLERDMEGAKFWVKHLENLTKGEQVKLRMNERRHRREEILAEKRRAKKEGKGGK
ncbi:hypothetical protein DOTSEDRAFT_27464 [Dothistroma septosporum NZE10]|uniref:SET domain-containing protein n=1 Tax=Dothistroma septosporum (strain NZE10 / CBS 128990) TaxID=675120 RepID=N1PE21_DOTSN|nr:hypothetical protein DOTSEDRAFT_27464 [Dothistroma septosporum NZE10]